MPKQHTISSPLDAKKLEVHLNLPPVKIGMIWHWVAGISLE
jgi:hypothetical protein